MQHHAGYGATDSGHKVSRPFECMAPSIVRTLLGTVLVTQGHWHSLWLVHVTALPLFPSVIRWVAHCGSV